MSITFKNFNKVILMQSFLGLYLQKDFALIINKFSLLELLSNSLVGLHLIFPFLLKII